MQSQHNILKFYIQQHLDDATPGLDQIIRDLDELFPIPTLWQHIAPRLAAYLNDLCQQQGPVITHAAACGLKRFVNSQNCALEGRYYRKKIFLDIYSRPYESPEFAAFNQGLSAQIDGLHEQLPKINTSLFEKLYAGAATVVNTVKEVWINICKNPLPVFTVALVSQAHIVQAMRNVSAASNLADNLQEGLVAYYPFDGSAADHSGNGNHGTVFGAVPCGDRFNHSNSAYCFDGQSYILGFADRFPTSLRSLSLWFKPANTNYSSTLDQGGWLFSYGGGSISCPGTSFELLLNNLCGNAPANSLDIQSNCQTNRLLYNLTQPVNTWTHVVYMTDFYTHTTLYVNGSLAVSDPTLFMSNTFVNGTNFIIGGGVSLNGVAPDRTSNCSRLWKGSIDELMLYNRTLSSGEVSDLFTQTSKPTGFPATTLPANTTLPSNVTIPPQPGTKTLLRGVAIGAGVGGGAVCCLFVCGLFAYRRKERESAVDERSGLTADRRAELRNAVASLRLANDNG